MALRAPSPLGAPTDLAVTNGRGGSGTARVAVRAAVPERGVVLVGARGTIHVEPGRTVTGTLDVVAPSAPGAPDSVRLTGSFRDVPLTSDLCPPVSGGAQ
jgi:hypothetical protein